MDRLVIIGAGGFGREVYAAIEDTNRVKQQWDVIGFLDVDAHMLDRFPHYPSILGDDHALRNLGSPNVVCAVGNPKTRKQIVQRLDYLQARWATIIHPDARIGPGVSIGKGCILCAGAMVTADAHLGNHVHINCRTTIGHDTRIGDYCTLSPHIVVCGHASLEEGCFLGSNATILPSVRIGAWATVGAGTVAVRNVAAGRTVFGVPAKEIYVPNKVENVDETNALNRRSAA